MTTLFFIALGIAWLVLGGWMGNEVNKIKKFDKWRFQTSERAFRRSFDPGSEPDFFSIFLGPISILILLYHLWAVDWDKEQRRLWKEKHKDEELMLDSKKDEALRTLRKNHEKERESKLSELEKRAGIR